MTRTIHLVGIGGAGLSAIARILHQRGERVTGSDLHRSEYAESLEHEGVAITYAHRAGNIEGADLVIASSAVPATNVELQAASQAGIPVLKRATFLPELAAGLHMIAVAGTHGKSTTSGMLAYTLSRADLSPSYLIGGMLIDLQTNAGAGTGPHFVIEADEYDHTFLGLHPEIGVVTNVEHDHPDCYPSYESFYAAFAQFAAQVSELLIVCLDDPGAAQLSAPEVTRWTYGVSAQADWRAEDIRPKGAGGSDFLLVRSGQQAELVRTRLPGKHNVLNTLAALAALHAVGVDLSRVREALADFQGIRRRFEVVGEARGVTVVDDYAHHPSEIRATLQAARQRYPHSSLWAVFQPHTYSRTRALLDDFTSAFSDADHVIVTEIFASREEPDASIQGGIVAERMEHPDVRYIPDLAEAADALYAVVDRGDVVLTLSAGDANSVGRRLLNRLESEGG